MPPSWIVFDYGKVLSTPTRALPALAEHLGVTEEALKAPYMAERPVWDRTDDALAYWQAVGERLGVPVDADLSERLTRIDVDGWSHTDPAALHLVDELHAAGRRLAVLSNAPSRMGRLLAARPWAARFEHLLFSGDLALAKPDPRIYRELLAHLGTAPERCLFLDDRQDNVDAARELGIQAEVWRGAATGRAALRERGLLR
ncbi:HAD family hydrolase [Salinifilum ghardaiensis]